MAVGTVSLRDGTPVVIRPIDPSDRSLLVEGFEHLSERSRYQRFFRVIDHLHEDEVDFFVNVDHDQHEALGATTPDGARTDEAQGRGLGRILVGELAELARTHGIEHFVAQTGVSNRPFRRIMERLGPMRTLGVEGGTIELETTLERGAALAGA